MGNKIPGVAAGRGAKPNGQPRPNKRIQDYMRPQTRFERLRNKLESVPRMKLYIGVMFASWLFLTAIVGLTPSHFGIFGLRDGPGYRVGDVAQVDEFATRAVSYEDPAATGLARNEAANAVDEIYRRDEAIPGQVAEDSRAFFARVAEIRRGDAPEGEKVAQVLDTSPFNMTEATARSLVFLGEEDFRDVERYSIENLTELYELTAVAEDGVSEIPASDVIRISEARNRLTEAGERDASGETGSLIESLSRGLLQPNYVIDRRATEAARTQAEAAVEPVQSTVQPGELVVARGELLDREDVAKLDALGNTGETDNPWRMLLGVALIVAAQIWMARYFLERFGRQMIQVGGAAKLVLAASLVVLFTVVARLFMLLSLPAYTIPLAGLSILGTILLGPRLMFLIVVVSSVNIGIIAGSDFLLAAALLISSGFAIYTVVRVGSRDQLLRAGVIIAVVTAVVTFAISLVGGATFPVALWQGVLGLINGVLSLMIAMVLLPVLENTFNLLTPMKLLELSDPGSQLLQKLLRRAPGTFSHSMQVGVMSENAAKRIGANAMLARVGAYYHDIGKMEHPAYFIENQIGYTNPHNALSPTLSAKVIKRHVKDGIEIGRNWGLPQEIIDIIAQHHGLTRIEYFYRKALEENPEGTVRESDFRYSSGRPKSKEAGILMIADTVEATVRSLPKPTPKRIEEVIQDTISRKLEDGQFDESDLTLREIHEVGEAVRESVIGFLGPRIEYPQEAQGTGRKKQPVKSAARAGDDSSLSATGGPVPGKESL
ncbi:HD family phosphohydrolase [Rubrobacter indicoceani]|uniref:HD family phosphohydrolase n=1 Tax=Rubrobacter indicoceani TaxID=2051957 RepID=UPI000E5BA034|nr:HDIG domain-containing metalloprotein [Rubrobacter indicoceani]